MDNELYDYRKYDQVWKRVNPQENPYPEARGSAAAPPAEADERTGIFIVHIYHTIPSMGSPAAAESSW